MELSHLTDTANAFLHRGALVRCVAILGIVLTALADAPLAHAAALPGQWTRLADMPTARSHLAAGVIEGKLYVVGGHDGNRTSSVLERYDPATNRWERLADMPTARQGPAVGAVDGTLYVVGGYDGNRNLSVLERYSPATNRWERLADMPTARSWLAAGAIEGTLYVVGGYGSNVLERYDPATNRWERLADMPTARSGLAAGVIGGKLYVVGGDGGRNVLERYDPATNRWERLADMPTERSYLAANVIDGMLYIVGGHGGNRYLSVLERYERQPVLTVLTHPDPSRSYYSRFVTARWDSIAESNGYLWQINQDPASALHLPPTGEDWWTLEPRLSWVVSEGGTWYLHVAVIDLDGQVGEVYHHRMNVVDTPPAITCTTHPDPALVYPFPNVSLAWEQPGIDTVYALIDRNPRTTPTRGNAQAYTSSPIRFRNMPNGTHYVHIRGSDYAGTLGPTAHFQVNIGREATPAPPGAPRVATTDVDAPPMSGAKTAVDSTRLERLPPVAVLDFAAHGVDRDAAVLLSSRLRDALVRTGQANVYERTRVEAILREQGFQHSGCTSAECVVEIGQLVGVEDIIVGEVGRLGAAYLMSARLIDVETGRVVRTASSPGASSPDALLRYLPSMAWTLLSR